MATQYTITVTETKELYGDLSELKEAFPEEWGWVLEDGYDEETFVRNLVEEFGIDVIEEGLPDGPFSRVDGELSIVLDD